MPSFQKIYGTCTRRFGLQIVLVCLYSTPSHYHHCANLSEGIELIKMLVRYILSSVWVRLSIFSSLSIIQYMGLCIFSLSISLVMIERIYILCLIIIIKSEVWTIALCLGLGHETMVCAVCLSIFLQLKCEIEDAGTVVLILKNPITNFVRSTVLLYSCSLSWSSAVY